MPFVLCVIFSAILAVMCASSSSEARARRANYSTCRRQEELLLFYEKFFEYRQDPSREDPIGDALEDARESLWKAGYSPTTTAGFGRNGWHSHPSLRRAPFEHGLPIRHVPLYADVLRMRYDDLHSLYSMKGSFLHWVGREVVFDEEGWQQYCDEIDRKWEQLWNYAQPKVFYPCISKMNDSDVYSVVQQGGTLYYHEDTKQWSVYMGDKFLGLATPMGYLARDFIDQRIGSSVIMYKWGWKKPFESYQSAVEELSWPQTYHSQHTIPTLFHSPVTLEIDLLNRKFREEYRRIVM